MEVTTNASAERTRGAIGRLTELPAAVRVVQEALEATEDPLCTNEQLQEILSQDPGATADLLRLANSPFFGVSNLIRTLAMAVTVVGHARLVTLLRHLMATKLMGSLPAHTEVARECRSVALAAGVVCHQIAEQAYASNPDEFMIAGLLHNVGELALLSETPEEYQKVRELSAEMHLRMAEIAVLGVDQFQVSRWLLEAWSFPPNYIEAAGYWSTPGHSDVSTPSYLIVGIVSIGAQLARAWFEGLDEQAAISLVSASAFSRTRIQLEALIGNYQGIEERVERLERSL